MATSDASDAPLVRAVKAAKRLAGHADATPSLKGDDQVEFTKTFAHDLVGTLVALGGPATLQMYETVTETLKRCVNGECEGLAHISVQDIMEKLPMSGELAPAHELIDTVLQARAMG